MDPEFSSVSIVLLGRFVPQAYIPEALIAGNVISANDAARARIKTLVSNEILEFSLPWADAFITNNQFQLLTTEAPYIRICDFVAKALDDLHSDYVVGAFGVNLDSHFNMGSTQARDGFGKRLAPPSAWGSWGDVLLANMHGATAKENPLHGGLVSMQMRQPFLDEELSGWLDVWAGISDRTAGNTGVRLRSNHHHQRRTQENAEHGTENRNDVSMLTLLTRRFDDSVIATEKIFREVVRP